MDKLLRSRIEFEWDEGNREKNWVKHRISTKEPEDIFFDKRSFTTKDVKHSTVEDRFQVLGKTVKGKYLTVYFTVRSNKIRVISARPMSRKERKQYEQTK